MAFVILRQAASSRRRPGAPAAAKAICSGTMFRHRVCDSVPLSRAAGSPGLPPLARGSAEDDERKKRAPIRLAAFDPLRTFQTAGCRQEAIGSRCRVKHESRIMVRIRFLRLFMLVPPILALLAVGLGSLSPPVGFAVMLTAFVLFGLFAFLIVCPRCKKSPYVRVRLRDNGSERTEYAAAWTEDVCSRCGYDFYAGPDS